MKIENKNGEIQLVVPRLKKMHVLVLFLVIVAYIFGVKTGRPQTAAQAVAGTATKETVTQRAQPTQVIAAPTAVPQVVKVSSDDDPVLGDVNAPVTMIEFSDFECPFCKKFFEEAFVQIKKEYIDTGKVKLVYRDLPLPFHDPLSSLESVAANCARAQGSDETYFAYHDEIFKRTTSNGNGLTKEALSTIASDLGLQSAAFSSCLTSEKQQKEVKDDVAYAGSIGATGTPTFFIGKSTKDGVIEGTRIEGAYPFTDFKSVIEQALASK